MYAPKRNRRLHRRSNPPTNTFHSTRIMAEKHGLKLYRIGTRQMEYVVYKYELDDQKGMTGLYSSLREVRADIPTF